MSDPLEYLARAQECLLKAMNAPNKAARQNWLDGAENWLRMVPRDLQMLAEMFEKAARDQGKRPTFH